jgi:hypothetical protein
MPFSPAYSAIGLSPISYWGTPDTTKVAPLGTIMAATHPYWGGAEFIYLQAPLSTVVKFGTVMSYDVATAFLAATMANTAILGKAAAICINSVASSASAQYCWHQISGQVPVWSSASVAANVAIGVVAAGQAGTLAAGKQLQNARVTLPGTTTVVKTGSTDLGNTLLIRVPNGDGWFPGIALTGTGVGASALLVSSADDGKNIVVSVASTATGTVSLTGTYNDATNFWNVVTCNRIGMQGPIT